MCGFPWHSIQQHWEMRHSQFPEKLNPFNLYINIPYIPVLEQFVTTVNTYIKPK